MYECASYCLEEGKQSEQRTKNRVEKGLETNKEGIWRIKYKNACWTIPLCSSGWRRLINQCKSEQCSFQALTIVVPRCPGTATRDCLPMTTPEIGRSPHTHFLGPSLTQAVWNMIIDLQWNLRLTSDHTPVGLRRTDCNSEALARIRLK